MTLAEVKTILEGATGFSGKVAYYSFPVGNAPALPWIVYYVDYDSCFGADGITYHKTMHIIVELYTRLKDPTSENAVETALTNAGIFYAKSEEYIESEDVFQIIYEIEV